MAKQYGGSDDDASDEGKAVYNTLIDGGSSGFSALFGGWHSDGSFYNLGDYGNFWSGTEQSSGSAWRYLFDKSSGKLTRYYDDKKVGFSCWCIQDD